MKLRSRYQHLMTPWQAFWRKMRAWKGRRLPPILMRASTSQLIAPSWVLLHLIAVSIGISLLEMLVGPVHPLPQSTQPFLGESPFPVFSETFPRLDLLLLLMNTCCTCLLYLFLISLRPPWRRRWSLLAWLLLVLASVAYLIGLHSALAVQLRLGILAYGLIAYARVGHGRTGGWITSSLLAVIILMSIVFKQTLVVQPSVSPMVLQYLVWVTGLLFIQTLCGLGVQERAARVRGEQLVKALTEAQEQLRFYAVQAEELATMRERARVAREIHDTLAQGFAAIRMHLETSKVSFLSQPAGALQHLERACELASLHLRETRRAILDLRAEALAGQSLPVALTALAATWRPEAPAQGEAACHVSEDVCMVPLSPAVELAYYRVAQEALSNATCHGQATRITIELSIETHELCLTVTDNGSGFEPATLPNRYAGDLHGGFGIIGMRERLHLLHGRLEIISAPGAGTQVVAMIPLKQRQSGQPDSLEEGATDAAHSSLAG